METINILWTGGLDSTFRMCELSRADVTIQPYYLIDSGRKSVSFELKAMKRIIKILRESPDTKATINDVKTIPVATLEKNDKVAQAQKYLSDKYGLGSQYEFLANFTKTYGLKLEVGLESSVRGKATNALRSEAKLSERHYITACVTDNWGGVFRGRQ